MKNPIRDASQVIVAILLTTSMVVCNAAPAKQKPVEHKTTAIVAAKPAPAEPTAPPVAVPAPETVEAAPAVETPVVAPVVQPQAVYSGSHEDWMAAAGISANDYGAVDYIVSHESGWNPNATEPNSGAHGLPQALPYSKTGCGWTDPICQLQWASGYATARYGSWQGAYSFWVANHYW